MLGEPKGYVIIDKEITHSPKPGRGPRGEDLEVIYFEALKLKMVPVIDIAVDRSEYIVLGKSQSHGEFMWMIDSRDCISGLIPVELIRPGQVDPMEYMELFIKATTKGMTEEDIAEMAKATEAFFKGELWNTL